MLAKIGTKSKVLVKTRKVVRDVDNVDSNSTLLKKIQKAELP